MQATNWDDIRYFLALAREGSLSAAARALGVQHSTVSRRVADLECTLRLKLFHRLPRGWSLTTEGQALYAHACALEESMLALQRSAVSQSALAGRVRVSIPPVLLTHFLVKQFGEFHRKHPGIELELIGERRGAKLARGEADIAVRIAEPAEPGLVARRLGYIGYGLYGTPQWRAPVGIERSYIGFDDSMPALRQKKWLDARVGKKRYVLRSNDMQAMHEAAIQSWGVALLPHLLAANDTRLVLVEPHDPPPSLAIYLVMHADVRKAPRVRSTADYLVEIFKRHTELLDPGSVSSKRR